MYVDMRDENRAARIHGSARRARKYWLHAVNANIADALQILCAFKLMNTIQILSLSLGEEGEDICLITVL